MRNWAESIRKNAYFSIVCEAHRKYNSWGLKDKIDQRHLGVWNYEAYIIIKENPTTIWVSQPAGLRYYHLSGITGKPVILGYAMCPNLINHLVISLPVSYLFSLATSLNLTPSTSFRLSLVNKSNGKEFDCQCRRCKRLGFDPWVGKIPWGRKWQPTPVFWAW